MVDYHLKKLLLKNDEQIFYEFLLSTTDYFTDYKTYQPTQAEIRNEFWFDLPPDVNVEQKGLYGIFHHEKLIGFVDLLYHYPFPKNAMIGYLVLHHDYRGLGLGQQIYSLIEQSLINNDYQQVYLGVITTNTSALRLWQKLGFVPFESIETPYGEQINMKKNLASNG